MFNFIDSIVESFETDFKKSCAVVFITSFMIAFTIGTVIIMTTPIASGK